MKTTYKIGEWEEEHKQNWINALNHKRQLDTLPDFSSRLQYWQEEVSKSGIIHEMDYVGDTGKVAFQLSPKPETDDDKQQLAKFRLSWYREMYTKKVEKVFKLDWKGFDDEDYAFTIRSLDFLKTDLDQRLCKSIRPDDFLRQELDGISEAIASGGFRKIKPEYDRAVKSLRQSIETNQPLDLLHFDKTVNHARGIELLAMIWDIVHYESYLKDIIIQKRYYFQDVSLDLSPIKRKKDNAANYTELQKNNKEKEKRNSTKTAVSNKLSKGFEDYILEEDSKTLIPYLKQLYKDSKPEQFAYLLFALADLGVINKAILRENLSKLHRDLVATFGEFGTREGLRQAIERLYRASSSEEVELKQHIKLIKHSLKN